MKTTIEISHALFGELKRVASEQRRTMRSLLEEGLRTVLDEHRAQPQPRGIRDARYGAGGLNPEFEAGGWDTIRDAIYEGRGRDRG
jgi:predicted transcriptional regulator